ncbi:MAG: hypothetical protein GWO04_37355, partial [Actinobacteria bacterium]|nr:hypothetical protein [Actinomycetota bacterium]
MRWLWSALVVLAAACTCPPGTADCDGDCVSLETDEDHCGACGSVCGGGGLCREG